MRHLACGFRNRSPHAQFRFPPPQLSMNILKAVLLKLASALLFAVMQTLVRALGDKFPVGQIVFFRSAFAILPVVLIYAWRHELRAAMRTRHPFAHVSRGFTSVAGMFLNFAALARLPLVEATAISFLSPLITVGFAAVFLKERVRIYRWSAVVVGFLGVLVMLTPHLTLFSGAAATTSVVGATLSLCAAFTNAGAVIQTRRLTDTETTPAIVFYFSLFCAVGGLLTLPFGWQTPSALEVTGLIALGICGGLAHILLTESYRYAPASLVAPFDYSAMLWALMLGYAVFGEVPTAAVFIGSVIVAGAGLFVIWRERQLGLRRAREAEGPPTAT
jgi:drug/metabolite transporter (DMT)-like permease